MAIFILNNENNLRSEVLTLLANKSDISHTHPISSIIGLTKTLEEHTHTANSVMITPTQNIQQYINDLTAAQIKYTKKDQSITTVQNGISSLTFDDIRNKATGETLTQYLTKGNINLGNVSIEGPLQLNINQTAIYKIKNFDSFINYAVTLIPGGGAVSIVGDTITYTAGEVSGEHGFIINNRTIIILTGEISSGTVITTPTITILSNSALNPAFLASPFSSIPSGLTPISSDWELSLLPDFSTKLDFIHGKTENINTWSAVTSGNYPVNQVMYIRVRYNTTTASSEYSSTSFIADTTSQTPQITAPTLTLIGNIDTKVFAKLSDFAFTGPTQHLVSVRWSLLYRYEGTGSVGHSNPLILASSGQDPNIIEVITRHSEYRISSVTISAVITGSLSSFTLSPIMVRHSELPRPAVNTALAFEISPPKPASNTIGDMVRETSDHFSSAYITSVAQSKALLPNRTPQGYITGSWGVFLANRTHYISRPGGSFGEFDESFHGRKKDHHGTLGPITSVDYPPPLPSNVEIVPPYITSFNRNTTTKIATIAFGNMVSYGEPQTFVKLRVGFFVPSYYSHSPVRPGATFDSVSNSKGVPVFDSLFDRIGYKFYERGYDADPDVEMLQVFKIIPATENAFSTTPNLPTVTIPILDVGSSIYPSLIVAFFEGSLGYSRFVYYEVQGNSSGIGISIKKLNL